MIFDMGHRVRKWMVLFTVLLIPLFCQSAHAGCSINDMDNDPQSQHWLVEHNMAGFDEEDIDYSNLTFAEACSPTSDDRVEMTSVSPSASGSRLSGLLLPIILIAAIAMAALIAVSRIRGRVDSVKHMPRADRRYSSSRNSRRMPGCSATKSDGSKSLDAWNGSEDNQDVPKRREVDRRVGKRIRRGTSCRQSRSDDKTDETYDSSKSLGPGQGRG